MKRIVCALMLLLLQPGGANASHTNVLEVDRQAIKESRYHFHQRAVSKFVIPRISSRVLVHVGHTEGALSYRQKYCSTVTAKVSHVNITVLNEVLNNLSDKEKGWALAQILSIPIECIALINQMHTEGDDILLLSPEGDTVLTRSVRTPVLSWEAVGTHKPYTAVLFLGSDWVFGIEQ